MHSFEVHSNESTCRKSGRLGLEQVIKSTCNTIALWLHKTVNCTYNLNIPKKKSQKNDDTNIEYSVRYKEELVGRHFHEVNFCKHSQAETIGEKYSSDENILAM